MEKTGDERKTGVGKLERKVGEMGGEDGMRGGLIKRCNIPLNCRERVRVCL